MTTPTTPSKVSEAALQRAVLDLAKLRKWTCAHFRPARVQCKCGNWRNKPSEVVQCRICKGDGYTWRTPVEADGAGFPDLVLVRHKQNERRRLLFVELKSDHGRVSVEQRKWLDLLAGDGVEAYTWRPEDWNSGEIERRLM